MIKTDPHVTPKLEETEKRKIDMFTQVLSRKTYLFWSALDRENYRRHSLKRRTTEEEKRGWGDVLRPQTSAASGEVF